jgi:hypothetical protein
VSERAAMLDEAGFVALCEHLSEVRPIFDDFCARTGFVNFPKLALGRYPRIRIVRPAVEVPSGTIKLSFELYMEFDEHGQRFELFRPDLPYTLEACAQLDIRDDPKRGVRYWIGSVCFAHTPFHSVIAVLQREMESRLSVMELWDRQYIEEHGRKSLLRA